MRKKLLKGILLICVLYAQVSWATNGYFSHGFSIKDKGLAGAGVALPQDSLSAINNPALIVYLGSRMDFGINWFSPMRSYEVNGDASQFFDPVTGASTFSIGPQSIDSDNENFFLPQFGRVWNWGDKASLGFSLFANGGMNSEYDGGTATFFFPDLQNPPGQFVTPEGTFGDGKAGIDLAQLGLALTYAYKVGDHTSIGISPTLIYQRIKVQGIDTFAAFSLDPDSLSDNGYDSAYGFGVRFGIYSQVIPNRLALGLSYQPKISMTNFEEYQGLFAQGGSFDIPSNLNFGLNLNITPHSHLLFDIQQIWYEGVDSIGNGIEELTDNCIPANPFAGTAATGSGCLGGSDGAGFGWKDMTIYKIGYQWQTGANWTWRLGYSHATEVIPEDQVLFNILAPAVVEDHFTFGFTRLVRGGRGELNFSAMYAPNNTVKGTNTFDTNQEIEIEMNQFEIGLGYSWLF